MPSGGGRLLQGSLDHRQGIWQIPLDGRHASQAYECRRVIGCCAKAYAKRSCAALMSRKPR
jgi:hypothetical protein